MFRYTALHTLLLMATTAHSESTVHDVAACPNCGQDLLGKYCHLCGERKVHGHDLALKHFFLHALHEFTHLDSRVFATIRYLFTRPGFLTQEFVAGRRARYMKPLPLFLIATALFFVVSSYVMLSGFEVRQLTNADKTGKMDAAWEKLSQKKHLPKEIIVDRVQETMHKVATAAQLANVLAMAALLALFFRRHYFVEHLVFSLHFLSFTYLASVVTAPLHALLTHRSWQAYVLFGVTTIVYCAYLTIGLRRFYREGMSLTIVKAICVYAVTQVAIIFTMILAIVGAVIRAMKS